MWLTHDNNTPQWSCHACRPTAQNFWNRQLRLHHAEHISTQLYLDQWKLQNIQTSWIHSPTYLLILPQHPLQLLLLLASYITDLFFQRSLQVRPGPWRSPKELLEIAGTIFLQAGCPSCRPTNQQCKGKKNHIPQTCSSKLTWVFQPCL